MLTVLICLFWVGGGMFVLRYPLAEQTSLTMALALIFIADGFTRFFYSFELQPMKGWGWMTFSGAVGIVAGFVLGWEILGGSAVLLGLIAGIRMIAEGVGVTTVALALEE